MTDRKEYRKYPYKERYPNPENPRHPFYAFFRLNGVKIRKSLRTRNERFADVKFSRLIEDLDKGVIGFSLKPKPVNFVEFARTYLVDGVHDLAPASRQRHRQNLFGILKQETAMDSSTVLGIWLNSSLDVTSSRLGRRT